MIYCEFKDKKLPMLSVGMMRLPVIDGVDADIDEAQVEKMVAYAMDQGANYFDTAWGYHGGNSELVAGRVLSKYPRESFMLASKFPGYDLSNMGKTEEIFEEQLKKCQVDYFDFYLIHNVCDLNIDAYLDESYGTLDYLLKQKEAGRIKHLGFSAHGGLEVMERFLKVYGPHMEFCQLQVNWLDWTFQKAKEKIELINKWNLPLWVMEPLRGGRLASLSEADEAALRQLRPDEGIPAWSFRFLQTVPETVVILGGMSSYEQMVENIATFEEEKPLNDEEMLALQNIAQKMTSETSLPCTECRYCISHCPQELDIPYLIELYNQRNFTGAHDFIAPMSLGMQPKEKHPSACIACGSCEAVCPQQLKIADAMADFAQLMKSA